MLKKRFGPKKGEVMWEWKLQHREELNNLYSSPGIIRVATEGGRGVQDGV